MKKTATAILPLLFTLFISCQADKKGKTTETHAQTENFTSNDYFDLDHKVTFDKHLTHPFGEKQIRSI